MSKYYGKYMYVANFYIKGMMESFFKHLIRMLVFPWFLLSRVHHFKLNIFLKLHKLSKYYTCNFQNILLNNIYEMTI